MLKKIRNNKKGFSLVELIIVIAIMVALVAVMAPSFVKYVKSSRDATMTNAAESVLEYAKSEYAVGNIKAGTDAKIQICKDASNNVVVKTTGITAQGELASMSDFIDGCGVSGSSASELIYVITILDNNGQPTYEMETVAATVIALS